MCFYFCLPITSISYSIWGMHPIATWSVCRSQPWSVPKRLNKSRCLWVWTRVGLRNHILPGARIPHKKGHFGDYTRACPGRARIPHKKGEGTLWGLYLGVGYESRPLHADLSAFGDSIKTIKIRFKRSPFDLRFESNIFWRFDLKQN